MKLFRIKQVVYPPIFPNLYIKSWKFTNIKSKDAKGNPSIYVLKLETTIIVKDKTDKEYRNTFNDVNDYINALKDTHSPHHNFVMDELINNKIMLVTPGLINVLVLISGPCNISS